MALYALDTDIATLLLSRHPHVSARVTAEPHQNVWAPIVTAQELIAGWLPQLTRQQPADRYVWAYAGLQRVLEFLSDANLLPFDDAAMREYARLRMNYRRLGTNDLRIAAIALSTGATLVTRNKQDFGQIAGLRIEDWTQ